MIKLTASLTILIFFFEASNAQNTATNSVTGTVIDSVAKKPLANVNISMVNSGDSSSGTTDKNGLFRLQKPAPGKYTLMFSFIGYKTRTMPVSIEAESLAMDIGTIQLAADSNKL